MFYYSRDRAGEHPQAHLANYAGIFQADAYGGYNKLYEPDRKPGPILEAACWVHARRPFFIMADVTANARRKSEGKTPAPISPPALEAVRRIDALFEIERSINGQSAEQRRAVRRELSAPLVADLESWMREQRAKLGGGVVTSPRQWSICSNAGPRSPASSTMAASACQTMQRNERCAE